MRQCYEEENLGDDDCVAEELDNFNQDVVVDNAPDFVKLFVSQLKSLNVKFPTLECTSRKVRIMIFDLDIFRYNNNNECGPPLLSSNG